MENLKAHTSEAPSLPQSSQYDLAHEFLKLGKKWVNLWAHWDVKVKFTHSDDLLLFNKASLSSQLSAIKYLQKNVEILEQMLESQEDPKKTQRYIWRVVSYLKLTPPSDFMNYIENDDVVEIYCLSDEIQVFRNHRFMEMTSFTLEQLLFLPWYKLSKRSWKHMLHITRVVIKFKLGFIKEPMAWDIPEHQFKEIGTEENNLFDIQLKYLIPLTYKGKTNSLISTNKSSLVGSQLELSPTVKN